jgi:hypothetical protein
MAIVTCTSCGRLLYRPDEITGTAWQCISCGPTEIEPDDMEVPERLAQLLEEECKRVVWQMIYPHSDSFSRNPPLISGQSPKEKRLLPEVEAISQKQEQIAGGSHTWWIAWIFAVSAAMLILPLAISGWKAEFQTPKVVLMAFAGVFTGIALVYYLLAVRPIRRRRLRRILESSTLARSPSARNEASSTSAAITEREPESAADRAAEQNENAGQFRE